MELSILKVDLQNSLHCDQVIKLLNDYMNDTMGNSRPMPEELGPQIIAGLKKHTGFHWLFRHGG